MSVYKSTKHILDNPFEALPDNIDRGFVYPYTNEAWNYSTAMTIWDIKMWEQIYYEPGWIGIYGAHVPKIEFYMITYNLFIEREKGIETFYGVTASKDVVKKASLIGIDLPVYQDHIDIIN